MANENRYYKTPFAESGNKTEVPDVSTGGAVGYDTGFGPDYELPQGSVDRKRIERDMYNGVWFGATKNLKQWQEGLYPTWIEDDGDGVAYSYPEGMIVSLAGVNYTSIEAANQEEPGTGNKWVIKVSDINDLSQAYDFKTLADLVSSTNEYPDGKILKTLERTAGNGGGGKYTKITGVLTANTYNIIASTQTDSSFVLVEDAVVYANQYNDNTSDIGAAWNFADARANTEGWPLVLPAGNFSSSIGLTWDGILHSITGAGVDLTNITFTADVQGVRIRGGYIAGFQLIGIGALATQVGMVIDQNQTHVMRRIRITGFFDNYEFNGGNSSDFADIFGVSAVRHGWNNTLTTPDSNAVTCGMMNFKLCGGTGFNFETGTPSNVSQQWKGGTIVVQQNGKGFNISGRGHDLTFYDELSVTTSTLDAECRGSQVRMLFGVAIDNGDTGSNNITSHRQGAAEAISNSNWEVLKLQVRDRQFAGQFSLSQVAANKLVMSEDGSSAVSTLEISSLSAEALNVDVEGRLTGRQSTNTDLAVTFDARFTRSAIITNSAVTTISSITGSKGGQEITFIFADGNTTIQNGSNIRLAGGVAFDATLYDTITLMYTGATWRELSRSINA